MKRAIYQAGPLFSLAEQDFHRRLKTLLESAGHTVIWPGELLTGRQIAAAGVDGKRLIFQSCRDAINRCTCMVALLDGSQVDDGTAWEIGYAHARGIPVYGLRTDHRQGGDTSHSRVNSMIEGCLASLARTPEELIIALG